MVKYIKVETFENFCENQNKLINILNHRMTKMEVHVNWIRKIQSVQTALLTGTFLTLLGIFIKLVIL